MLLKRKLWCYLFCVATIQHFTAHAEHLSCVVCDPGTYCFNDATYACPIHSNSTSTSGDVSACVCKPGYYKVQQEAEAFVCESCPGDAYCYANNRYACPPDSTSVVLSSAVTDCKCMLGFSGNINTVYDTEACQPCAAGTFKDVVGNVSCDACDAAKYSVTEASITGDNCLSCPDFSSSSTGSGAISDCLCLEGYTEDEANENMACIACEAGKFNNETGGTCQDCGQGTYTATEAMTTCTSCPVHSNHELTAQTSADVCVCNNGFVFLEGVCTGCLPGSFNTGEQSCTLCPNNTFSSTSSATTCETCPDFSISPEGSNQLADCNCEGGYQWTSTNCAACEPGYYKSEDTQAAESLCTVCPTGTYTSSPAAIVCTICPNNTYQNETGQASCQACHAHSTSAAGSTDAVQCACLPGYFFCTDCHECKPCAQGSFKSTTANTECTACEVGYFTASTASTSSDNCTLCPANSYTTIDDDVGVQCLDCPLNTVSLAGAQGIASCVCMAGYTGQNTNCIACEVGKYKPLSGAQSCILCPDGYIGVESLTPDEARNSKLVACTECAANTYSSSLTLCAECPANTKAPQVSNELTDCKCLPGYTGQDGSECAPCAPGTYKSVEGSTECVACPADTYQAQDNATSLTACLSCAQTTTSAEGSTHCVCKAGYTEEGENCVSCPAGSYKPTVGSDTCTACATGTYFDGVAPFSSNKCKHCPTNSQNIAAGVGVDSCACQAGYIKDNAACRPCTAGFYCPTETQEIQCYYGATASEASSSVNDCVCLPGFYANCTGESCHHSCLLCPVNFYCPGAQSASGDALVACPSESSTLTLAGSGDISDCKCNPGWYKTNNETGTCLQCTEDTYCVNEQQYVCPPNSTALAGTASISQCYCDEYFTRDAANTCQLCGSHLVCRGVQTRIVDGETILQAGTVDICAQGSANVNQKCVCQQGSYCNTGTSNTSCVLGSNCHLCLPGHTCADNMLITCGANQTSNAGSYHPDHCQCKEGYYLTANGQCLICPLGAFCSNETLTWCSDFDSSLTTFTLGSHSRDHCVCPLGKFRLYRNDTCKICPRNYYCPSEQYTLLPNAVACESNELTSTIGNVDRASCTCANGFVMSSDADTFMKCMPCLPGQRCAGGVVLETFCHINNRTANIDHSECVCQAGFEEDSQNLCVPCQTGYVKAHIGNDACMPCNHGNYYLNSTTCSTCDENEETTEDYLSCVYVAPLVRHGSSQLCVPCAQDYYYVNGECLACPEQSSTNGLAGQSGLDACTCKPGYHDTDTNAENIVCESCAIGFYSVDGVCQSCGAGALTDPASADANACYCNATLCQQFVWGDACAGECAVTPAPCTACAPGHYKPLVSALGNTDVCLQCGQNTYQELEGQTSCVQCHETRRIPFLASTTSIDCVCARGFEETDNTATACSACVDGYFKSDIGDYSCSACHVGSFATGLENTICLSCVVHSLITGANTTLQDANTHVDNCTCLAGYTLEPDADECVECIQGSFKSSPGEHSCRLCGEDITETMVHDLQDTIHRYGDDETTATSNGHCLPCPANSGQDSLFVTAENPMATIADCLCFPAHDSFDEATGCQHCSKKTAWEANYSFKLGYSNEDCQLCAAGKYFQGHNIACDTCLLNDADNATRKHTGIVLNAVDQSLTWGTSFEDCDCELGSTRVVDTCHECLPAFYRNDSLVRACQPCGLDEYQDATGQTACKACPANSYTVTTQNAAITDCLCEAGYEWHADTQTCEECAAGTQKGKGAGTCQICPENTYSLARAAICIDCPANERSLSASGSPFACNCKPGYGSESGLACSICANGTFSEGGEGAATQNGPQQRPACTACPTNKNSTQGSTTRANCKCIPGHGDPNNDIDDAATCSPCENGFYASGGSNIACFSCGFGAITDPPQAAFAFSCCQCDAARGLYEDL